MYFREKIKSIADPLHVHSTCYRDSRPANAHGFAVRLTVSDQISRSHGCYRKPHGFLAFLAIKNLHYLAYHLDI